MKELIDIYEQWSTNSLENKEIREMWLRIERTLPPASDNMAEEGIRDYIMQYTLAVEKAAFISGYKKAVHLLREIFDDSISD